jgi:hypothetical protein
MILVLVVVVVVVVVMVVFVMVVVMLLLGMPVVVTTVGAVLMHVYFCVWVLVHFFCVLVRLTTQHRHSNYHYRCTSKFQHDLRGWSKVQGI